MGYHLVSLGILSGAFAVLTVANPVQAQSSCQGQLPNSLTRLEAEHVQELTLAKSAVALFSFEVEAESGYIFDLVSRDASNMPASGGSPDLAPNPLVICRAGVDSVSQVFPQSSSILTDLGYSESNSAELADGHRFGMNLEPGSYVVAVSAGAQEQMQTIEIIVRKRTIAKQVQTPATELTFTGQAAAPPDFDVANNSIAVFLLPPQMPAGFTNATIRLDGVDSRVSTEAQSTDNALSFLPDPVLSLAMRRPQDAAWSEIAQNDDQGGEDATRLNSLLAEELDPNARYAIIARTFNGGGRLRLRVELSRPQRFDPEDLRLGQQRTVRLRTNSQNQGNMFQAIYRIPATSTAARYTLVLDSQFTLHAELGYENPLAPGADRFVSARSIDNGLGTGTYSFDLPASSGVLIRLSSDETPPTGSTARLTLQREN